MGQTLIPKVGRLFWLTAKENVLWGVEGLNRQESTNVEAWIHKQGMATTEGCVASQVVALHRSLQVAALAS